MLLQGIVMIESITMQGVASYCPQTPITINTKKKNVFLYGHNGSGKSTIARFIQDQLSPKYNKCSAILPNATEYESKRLINRRTSFYFSRES